MVEKLAKGNDFTRFLGSSGGGKVAEIESSQNTWGPMFVNKETPDFSRIIRQRLRGEGIVE